jgi:hypothetical protein
MVSRREFLIGTAATAVVMSAPSAVLAAVEDTSPSPAPGLTPKLHAHTMGHLQDMMQGFVRPDEVQAFWIRPQDYLRHVHQRVQPLDLKKPGDRLMALPQVEYEALVDGMRARDLFKPVEDSVFHCADWQALRQADIDAWADAAEEGVIRLARERSKLPEYSGTADITAFFDGLEARGLI